MSQASVFLQQLVNIFSCNRRNTACSMDLKKIDDNATKIDNNGGASLGCRSNASTDLDSDSGKASIGGSDTDDSSVRLRTDMPSSANRSPVLPSPPGLELLVRERYTPHKHVVNKRSNTEAKISVPETRKSSHKFEECLRDLSASTDKDLAPKLAEVIKRRLQREQNDSPQKELPPSLGNVLRKLTTKDAAIVKAAFEAAEVSRTTKEPWAIRFPSRASVKDNFRKLAEIDPNRIFMVRKINKLGLSSPEILKAYFSKFGLVEDVYVAHSVDKRHLDVDPDAEPIVLPAGFGHIVMESAEDVVNIFQQGLEHTISDVSITVTAYENHTPQEAGKGLQVNQRAINPRGPRYPSYANITEDNTLRSNLRKMAAIDASRIFMVRRINKLGFGSAQMLRTHFGKVGVVSDVFITHSLDRRKKDPQNPTARPNVRPAGIGFVVMEKSEDVAAVLRNGYEQTVFGVNICVATYEHQEPSYEHQEPTECPDEASSSCEPK